MSARNCSATTIDGDPCQAPALTSGSYCYQHEPAVAERRDEARRRGGRNSSKVARLQRSLSANPTLGGVVEVLGEVTELVKSGEMSPAIGNSIASLSRAMIAAIEAADSATRLRELEAAIDRLLDGEGSGGGLRVVS